MGFKRSLRTLYYNHTGFRYHMFDSVFRTKVKFMTNCHICIKRDLWLWKSAHNNLILCGKQFNNTIINYLLALSGTCQIFSLIYMKTVHEGCYNKLPCLYPWSSCTDSLNQPYEHIYMHMYVCAVCGTRNSGRKANTICAKWESLANNPKMIY